MNICKAYITPDIIRSELEEIVFTKDYYIIINLPRDCNIKKVIFIDNITIKEIISLPYLLKSIKFCECVTYKKMNKKQIINKINSFTKESPIIEFNEQYNIVCK